MEGLLDADKLVLFILFFIPGFISIKIYEHLVARDKYNFSDGFIEVMGYSCLNYAFYSWLIWIVVVFDYHVNHPVRTGFIIFLIVFISPILWPFLARKFYKSALFKRAAIGPERSAWDHVFCKREGCWILVHLKDGTKIAGRYGTDSFASSYPRREDIYIQEIWRLDEDQNFDVPVPGSKGMMLFRDEIKFIEFFN